MPKREKAMTVQDYEEQRTGKKEERRKKRGLHIRDTSLRHQDRWKLKHEIKQLDLAGIVGREQVFSEFVFKCNEFGGIF